MPDMSSRFKCVATTTSPPTSAGQNSTQEVFTWTTYSHNFPPVLTHQNANHVDLRNSPGYCHQLFRGNTVDGNIAGDMVGGIPAVTEKPTGVSTVPDAESI
jgi:hypothetical protein